jgi:hypothetical protein
MTGLQFSAGAHNSELLWGPTILLSGRYWSLFIRRYFGQGTKLTSLLKLVPLSIPLDPEPFVFLSAV